MERYISVEKLKDALYEKEWQIIPPLKEVEDVIEEVASSNAEWARHPKYPNVWVCTACDKELKCNNNNPSLFNFCPNCGIPMKRIRAMFW